MIKVYEQQDKILQEVSRMAFFPFVLSGGTALSRFYLNHRISEDLDFYFNGFEFDFLAVEKVINTLRSKNLKCRQIGSTDKPGLLRAASYACAVGQEIKLDFLEDPFSGMWDPVKKQFGEGGTILVDHIDQIYYRKLYSVLHSGKLTSGQRTKDLVDIYYLHGRHKPLLSFMKYLRDENVPLPEGEIAFYLDRLDYDEFRQGMQMLEVSDPAETIYRKLKETASAIFEEGLA